MAHPGTQPAGRHHPNRVMCAWEGGADDDAGRTERQGPGCCWWCGMPRRVLRAAGTARTCCGRCPRWGASKLRGWWSAWRTTRSSGSCPARPCEATRPSSRWPGSPAADRRRGGARGGRRSRRGGGAVLDGGSRMRCCAPMARRSGGCRALVADGLVGAAPLEWPKGSTWLLQRPTRHGSGPAIWPRWPLAVAWKSPSGLSTLAGR